MKSAADLGGVAASFPQLGADCSQLASVGQLPEEIPFAGAVCIERGRTCRSAPAEDLGC